MAFMMPVMKNNFDIYKDSRSRKTSESSTGSSNCSPDHATSAAAAAAATASGGRSRRTGNTKADISDFTPSQPFSRQHQENHMAYRMQMKRCQSANTFQRNAAASRSTNSITPNTLSPSRSFSQSTTNKTMNKTNNTTDEDAKSTESNKFHLRLVDKLRRSFRKDNAKRT